MFERGVVQNRNRVAKALNNVGVGHLISKLERDRLDGILGKYTIVYAAKRFDTGNRWLLICMLFLPFT